MVTGLVSMVILFIEFLFGKVADESELKLFYEFRYLGALPVRNTRSEVEMRVVYNSVCHMLQSSYPEHHIVMVGTLPGGKIPSEMLDSCEWNYAMAGKRLLVLDMILASNFEDPGYNCDDMNIITYSGSKGYLPVTSKRLLAPTEIELLKIDLQTLRKRSATSGKRRFRRRNSRRSIYPSSPRPRPQTTRKSAETPSRACSSGSNPPISAKIKS